jgi:hypothetical protein
MHCCHNNHGDRPYQYSSGDVLLYHLKFHFDLFLWIFRFPDDKNHNFVSRNMPLCGRESVGIGHYFHCPMLAAPCSSDNLATWVAMRPQEVLQGVANIWQWKWQQTPRFLRHLVATFRHQNEKTNTTGWLFCAYLGFIPLFFLNKTFAKISRFTFVDLTISVFVSADEINQILLPFYFRSPPWKIS